MIKHLKQHLVIAQAPTPAAKPRVFSVSFRDNPESVQGVREDDAVGMVAEVAIGDERVRNDFDSVSIFQRPVFNATWNESAGRWENFVKMGEEGFTLTPTEPHREVVYRSTPFWYYADFEGEISPSFISVSDQPRQGFRLAPMFKNGTTPVYRPCFEMAIGEDGLPHSRAGLTPFTGSPNEIIGCAKEYSSRARSETLEEWFSDYLLLLVEFGTRDLQSIFGGHFGTDTPVHLYQPSGNEGDVNVHERFYVCPDIPLIEGVTYTLVREHYATGTYVSQNVVLKDVVFLESEGIYLFSIENEDYHQLIDGYGGFELRFIPCLTGTALSVVTKASSGTCARAGTHGPFVWRGKENTWGNVNSLIFNLICRLGYDNNLLVYYLKDGEHFDGTLNEHYELQEELAEFYPGSHMFIRTFVPLGEAGIFPSELTYEYPCLYFNASVHVFYSTAEDTNFVAVGGGHTIFEGVNHATMEILRDDCLEFGGRLTL